MRCGKFYFINYFVRCGKYALRDFYILFYAVREGAHSPICVNFTLFYETYPTTLH